MRLNLIFFTLFIIVLLASCQKETSVSSNGTLDGTTSKIKTYTEDVTDANGHNVVTFDLNYDANNRVISMVSESNAGDKFVYQYFSGSTIFDIYNSGVINIHNVLFLNTNYMVDSSFQVDQGTDTTTDKFFYNTSKQLAEDINYDFENGVRSVENVIDYSYGSDGNVSTMQDDEGTTMYTYYPDKINTIDVQTPFPFIGKNLIKTRTVDDGSGDIVTIISTYTFDSQNRITSETDKADNGDIFIKTYTYY